MQHTFLVHSYIKTFQERRQFVGFDVSLYLGLMVVIVA